MTKKQFGFFIERLSVSGPGRTAAELSFSDGLNVIAGASDTGKSYALSCVDHAFGASKPPRPIARASGYDTVTVRLRVRNSGAAVEITRGLSGGEASIYRYNRDGALEEELILPTKHDPNNTHTLSGFLLELCGLSGRRLRKNQLGETRTLSFRDIAFLVIVDEERIIAERPPQLSGSPIEKTVEGDAFRLLVTGTEAGQVITIPKKNAADAKAQLDLVEQMMSQISADLERLGIPENDVDGELERIEQARRATLVDYESATIGVAELQRELNIAVKKSRETNSRLVIIEGLTRRFELLNRHYDSDITRLQAIAEAGKILESFPARTCPVCGSPPNKHHEAHAEEPFRLSDVRAAAKKEIEKIDVLRRDLVTVLNGLVNEKAALELDRNREVDAITLSQNRINQELQPRLHASITTLQTQTERRDVILRAKSLVEQLRQLRKLTITLGTMKRSRTGKSVVAVSPSTSEIDAFAQTVEDILGEWNYPDHGRVVFSEDDQDLVIGGQPRVSHGKGVRALTCAAFINGILRHCRVQGLPHPSFVVLDSPLVAYREPEPGNIENQRLRQAGVKEAFYKSLSLGDSSGQVIVFENDDPPSDLPNANVVLFTRSVSNARYGFFPIGE